tara:strand:- start:1378 stop:2502 length:1125 start_codon:yes stop_codon:yes gene_type:complete
MDKQIKFNDLPAQWNDIKNNVLPLIEKLGEKGDYIGGQAILKFEKEFADYTNSKYAIGVSNGTDALKIAFQMFDLNENDCVILPTNTFIADYLAIKNCPINQPHVVLIDNDTNFTINTNDLSNFLKTEREKYRKVVVVPVHLYGYSCNMDILQVLKNEYDFLILEDCSQAHGTLYNNKHIGYLGDISVYSLYPGKNLGAMGDAGIITTNKEKYLKRAKSLRNYGSSIKYHYDELGNNHRMDTIQAIILSEKLKHLSKWTKNKNKVAQRYLSEIKNDKIKLPIEDSNTYNSYHIFCLRIENDTRENFQKYLNKYGITTIIHYPIPIHKTQIFNKLDTVYSSLLTDQYKDKIVSIPMHPYLSQTEITYIIKHINNF